jgi:hypothetical protein
LISVPRLLDLLRASLELRSALYFKFLVGFTVVLLIGAILDEADVLIRFKYKLARIFGGGAGRLRLARWESKIKHLGIWMVLIGIAGEGVFEMLASRADDAVRRFDSELLRDVGKQSSEANERAAIANKEAGEAKERAGKLDRDLQNERQKTARFQIEATKAEKALADELSSTTKLLAETESQLANVAVCNAPRALPLRQIIGPGIKQSTVDPLAPFFETKVTIEYLPDAETRRAAFNIAGILSEARWSVSRPLPVDGIKDGVEIEPYLAPLESLSIIGRLEDQRRANTAADALVDFLHSFDWDARTGSPMGPKGFIRDDNIIPPGGIRIQVGLPPARMPISTPGTEEIDRRIAQSEKDAEERGNAISKQRLNERMKNAPPEIQKEMIKDAEAFRAEVAKIESRYKSPCQTVTTPRFP